jgi:CO dehydrogenase nickel-insertion accessory protein CooC1
VSAAGRRVEFLARAIVNRLEDRGVVEFVDAEAGITAVTRTLTEDFAAVAAVERLARHKLGARVTAEQLENEMRRVAAERKVIL